MCISVLATEPSMHIHVIHENRSWLEPLAKALDAEGLPWREWYAEKGQFRLHEEPPDGIFYNRMSASSHTRGHRYAAEFTASTLAWLAAYGARIVNGPRALDLEISKVRQYAALHAAGIRTPRTAVVCGDKEDVILAARRDFAQIPWDRYRKWGGEEAPVILKPNRGGK